MQHRCPVCGYNFGEPILDSDICPSCGTQFGYHDATASYADLRQRWLGLGAPWHSKRVAPKTGWSAYEQLAEAGLKVPTAEPVAL